MEANHQPRRSFQWKLRGKIGSLPFVHVPQIALRIIMIIIAHFRLLFDNFLLDLRAMYIFWLLTKGWSVNYRLGIASTHLRFWGFVGNGKMTRNVYKQLVWCLFVFALLPLQSTKTLLGWILFDPLLHGIRVVLLSLCGVSIGRAS